jgi:hypothetical protein
LLFKPKVGYQVAILALVISGCTSTPPPKPLSDCQKVASYAKDLAGVRGVGVSEAAIRQNMSKSEVEFPIEGIAAVIFDYPTLNPDRIHDVMMLNCAQSGYNNFRKLLNYRASLFLKGQ